MGKHLIQEDSTMSLEDHSPGCKWGILHHFHNHKRHHTKKRSPHKRHGAEEHNRDAESTSNTLEGAKLQENIDSRIENLTVETKSMEPGPTPKSSMKSRIKAMITVEMPKRKGRHRRSSSEPMSIQLERTPSFNHLEPSDTELHDNAHSVAILDPHIPKIRENHDSNNGSCDFCAIIDNRGRPPVRNHTLLQDKFVEPRNNASAQGAKLVPDALDLLEMRKELFPKIVEDPRSSLTHQLQSRQKLNSRFGLTKSVSFPATRSIYRRAIRPKNDMSKQESGSCPKEEDKAKDSPKETGTLKKFDQEVEPSCAGSPTSTIILKKPHGNKGSFKHFKNLREKIKHVIRERKKEKNHIIRDGVLHKVPFGSKDTKEDNHMHQELNKFSKNSPRSSSGSDQLGSDRGKSPLHHFKKTSSFNESFDRYDQLLETRYNRDSKNNMPDRVRFKNANTLSPSSSRRATFGRILSLPDLRSYSYFQNDDSPSTSSMDTPARISAGNGSAESSRLSEQKSLRIGSQSRMQPFAISESGSEDNFVDVGENFDESSDSQNGENAAYHDLNLEPGLVPSRPPSKLELASEIDYNHQDSKSSQRLAATVSEDAELGQSHHLQDDSLNLDSYTVTDDIETPKNQVEHSYDDLLHVRMDMKDKPEFSYVKDVLELSGFSRNEILGKLHSADQPVDPLVFEVVEGCLVAQPSADEEDGSCDHFLLSDLINEVLLNIYERSLCSWPKPLTCRSNMHRMPVGYHVLEEVWAEISWLLSWRPEDHQTIDDGVSRDLEKGDGWMSLQFDAECVGLEVEDLIFDDLLEEIICT